MSSKLLSRRRPKHHSSASTATSSSSPESPQRDSSPSDGATAASTPSDSGGIPQSVSDAFAEVHPSLVEYLSLFPATASLAVVDPTQQTYNSPTPMSPNSPMAQQQMQNHFAQPMNGMSSSTAPYSQFFGAVHCQPAQTATSAAQRQAQTQAAQQIPHASPESLGYLGEPMSGVALPDMGFTEDVLMGEHWMSLMRETGILDSNGNFIGMQNAQFSSELMF